MRKTNFKKSLSNILEIDVKNKLEKFKTKIPSWNNFDLEIPSGLAIEQASSELTAKIKQKIIEYETVIDLTGGLGVDSYFFALIAKHHIYIEKNIQLLDIVKKNFAVLGLQNVTFINNNSADFLENYENKVDLIYCDPSRRIEGKKVFNLDDSEPNVFEIFDLLKPRCRYFLLKTSPFLDISLIINKLYGLLKVILISIDGELKEVLYLFDFENNNEIEYDIKIISKDKEKIYNFNNKKFKIEYKFPLNYLYEPDSSILKLGNFSEIAYRYDLYKLESNSHLFTSNELKGDFPGKIYYVKGVENIDPKKLTKYSNDRKFNLKIRNFPDKVDNLKKRLKIKDGGNLFIFATKTHDNNFKMIICEKTII